MGGMSSDEAYASTANDSDTSTVSMGDERSNASSFFEAGHIDTNQDSFILSEIENSLDHSREIQEQDTQFQDKKVQEKVNVSDIFSRLKPSKVKKQEEELKDNEELIMPEQIDYQLPIVTPVQVDPLPKPQYGINARDILTGRPKGTKKKKEEVSKSGTIQIEEPVTVQNVYHETPKPKFGITAKDLLTGKQKTKASTPIPEDAEMIELDSSDEETEETTRRGKKKKKLSKSKEPKQSMIITLKYKPRRQRIADLESKIRNSMASSVSAKDLFKRFDRKRELIVNLKIDSEKLKTIDTTKDSFFTKGTPQVQGAKSYLDLLSYKPVVAKNPIHKLKEIQPPVITRESMHVVYDEPTYEHRNITLPLKAQVSNEVLDLSIVGERMSSSKGIEKHLLQIEYVSEYDLEEIAKSQVISLQTEAKYSKFYTMFKSLDNSNNSLWSTLFKPEDPKEILFPDKNIYDMKIWLANSFNILKKRTKRPNLRKLKRADVDEMDNFIIDDYDEETDDEAFVPIMILKGPEGVGKSSAVYSLVENLSGYVYEINASQARGRKDIMATLTELSTTQLVHKNQDSANVNEFQKGVILFEDVDVLFESDRGFWAVMEHILTISRRPIILTCKDINKIPSNIVQCAADERSLFDIPRQSADVLKDYLFLMALTKNIQLDFMVLDDLIKENGGDLRKCISNLQILCEISNPDNNLVIVKKIIDTNEIPRETIDKSADLSKFCQHIDCLSIADLISTTNKSLINHSLMENQVLSNEEFLDDEELRTPPLPFEFNIGEELINCVPDYPHNSQMNEPVYIKKLDDLFLKSRLKSAKRITRRSAMSMFDFDDDLEAKNIFNLPTSTYTTQVSPFFRAFSRYESSIDYYNASVIKEKGQSVEELYRSGLLLRKRFSAQSDLLLYGPLRYWNMN